MTDLLIVESPAKAKTLKKYLGRGFEVRASYGHVRDLVPKTGAVDPSNGFAMRYEAVSKNAKHIEELLKIAQSSEHIYLATDPDREGEAISWHILEIFKERGILKDQSVQRVVFYEVTQSAVKKALQHPRDISDALVDAYKARRALDYLVGFNLSPLLWKKVRRGLSAGRVQSPALRMLVEREQEIDAFVSQEYWTIDADIQSEPRFSARLSVYQKEKVQPHAFTSEAQTQQAINLLKQHASGTLKVLDIKKRERRRQPSAPFTTSTLQQDAARKLGFAAQRTMRTAQQLYEGINLPEGAVGLISYMRTDSVNLSEEAITQIRAFISDQYGPEECPNEPNRYKTKAKNAQEAHEAIRPTDVARTPESIRHALNDDQFKLYQLIWRRAVSSQMKPALYDGVSVDLQCGPKDDYQFRATGSTLRYAGFLKVYAIDEDLDGGKNEEDRKLPPLEVGQTLSLIDIVGDQHFTEPPPRFSEATLIKSLEEHGIGRPSTYASILSTLQQREYATLDQRRFKPTELGKIVNHFLTQFFERYVDYEFTANMEEDLDAISRNEKMWLEVLEGFWSPFKNKIDEINQSVQRKDVLEEAIDEACPKCSKPLTSRFGRRGRFIGCSGYPECDYTRDLDSEQGAQEEAPPFEERPCPKCEHPLKMRKGRYGWFVGCSNYPKCRYIESNKQQAKDPLSGTEVSCPSCKKGAIVQRRSRYGKIFYSCSEYPDCKYALWNPPLAEACPKCAWPITTLKTTKRRGEERVCPQDDCKHVEPYVREEPGASS